LQFIARGFDDFDFKSQLGKSGPALGEDGVGLGEREGAARVARRRGREREALGLAVGLGKIAVRGAWCVVRVK